MVALNFGLDNMLGLTGVQEKAGDINNTKACIKNCENFQRALNIIVFING
jgi:hypothetical protein